MPIDGILIDGQAPKILETLSHKLRVKTLQRASELDQFSYPFYTPWLCLRPKRDVNLKSYNITTTRYSPGKLITDAHYLKSATTFLKQNKDLTLDFLPGESGEWQVFHNILDERPEMVIQFEDLFKFVRNTSPFFNSIFEALVDMVIPMKQTKPQGMSTIYARGAIFLSFPPKYEQMSLALDFVHEMGHQALFLLQSVDPIIINGSTKLVYSEIRHTKRPAIMTMHAATAIAYMLKFCLEAKNPSYKHHDFVDPLSTTLTRAVRSLQDECEFSPIGKQILREFLELSYI